MGKAVGEAVGEARWPPEADSMLDRSIRIMRGLSGRGLSQRGLGGGRALGGRGLGGRPAAFAATASALSSPRCTECDEEADVPSIG